METEAGTEVGTVDTAMGRGSIRDYLFLESALANVDARPS